MSEELLINVTPQETRVATVENGMLTEIWVERVQKIGLVGTIVQGIVKRVLPGMEAAFVDIGLEKAAFLHVSDVHAKSLLDENGEARVQSISRLLKEGQKLAVQVIKDPLGTKGARVTSKLTAPSRFLVMMPYENNIGISARIDNEEERERLRALVEQLRGDSEAGYIVRTVAEGADIESLRDDLEYLDKVWKGVEERTQSNKPGTVIFRDLPLVQRMMRDMNRHGIERIRIDSRETFHHCVEFCKEYVPEISHCLEHYPGEVDLLENITLKKLSSRLTLRLHKQLRGN